MHAAGTPVWEDYAGPPLPSLTTAVEADCCIVGLGGSGLTAVGEALDAGLRVIGIDAGRVAGAAAGRNGGLLLAGTASFHHDTVRLLGRDRARALYALTLEQIARMAEETPDAIRRVGSLRLATTADEEADCDAQLAALRDDGFPATAYLGPEGRGLLIPSDAGFHPVGRCQLQARTALHRGAHLYEDTPALHVEPGRIETPAGTIRAGLIVVATDGRLGELIPALAHRVRSTRLQMLATAPAPEVRIPRPVYARYGMEYWQQRPDRVVVVGGFRDLGGDAEWTTEARPTPVVQEALEGLLRARLQVRAPVTHRWAACVTYHEGELPILAEIGPDCWAMGAYNGTGNLMGPLCARAAVRAARGDPAMADLLGAERLGRPPAAMDRPSGRRADGRE